MYSSLRKTPACVLTRDKGRTKKLVSKSDCVVLLLLPATVSLGAYMHFPTVSTQASTVNKKPRAVSKRAPIVSKAAPKTKFQEKKLSCKQEASNCKQNSCILLEVGPLQRSLDIPRIASSAGMTEALAPARVHEVRHSVGCHKMRIHETAREGVLHCESMPWMPLSWIPPLLMFLADTTLAVRKCAKNILDDEGKLSLFHFPPQVLRP